MLKKTRIMQTARNTEEYGERMEHMELRPPLTMDHVLDQWLARLKLCNRA